MRARLIALLLLLSVSTISYAADWGLVADSLTRSTIQLWCLEHEKPLCTAFSINQAEGYFVTAGHCVGDETVVFNGEQARVVVDNDDLDIAVIQFTNVRLPALRARTGQVRVGDEVAGFGYAYGLTVPLFRTAVVAASGLFKDGEYVALDKAFIGGMSGGPVVDRQGRVVGLVQQGDLVTAWTRTMKAMFEATAVYWEAR